MQFLRFFKKVQAYRFFSKKLNLVSIVRILKCSLSKMIIQLTELIDNVLREQASLDVNYTYITKSNSHSSVLLHRHL